MDYFIALEGLGLLAYLYYLHGKLDKVVAGHVSEGLPEKATAPSRPEKLVKILRLSADGKQTCLAVVPPEHEDVGLALATPGLAILHPDGTLQHKAGE